MLVLTQTSLINKILDTVKISDCNTQVSPTEITPLVTDVNGPHRKERCN